MKVQQLSRKTATIGLPFLLSAVAIPVTVPCSIAPAYAEDIEAKPVSKSLLADLDLPGGAVRISEKSLPQELSQLLKPAVEAVGPNARQGRIEVLAWEKQGKAERAASLQTTLTSRLKTAGWTYEEVKSQTEDTPMTMVMAVRKKPTSQGLIGFWIPTKDTVLLIWTEVFPKNPVAADDKKSADEKPMETTETPAPTEGEGHSVKGILDSLTYHKNVETPPFPGTLSTDTTATTDSAQSAPAASSITIGPGQFSVNVMKNAMPALPTFAKLSPKPNVVRGYVKDAAGKPLKGAVIGVRSSSAGGFYSGAQGKSDANGYYEIEVPWGAAEFYTASCTLDYADGRAAFGLHPADGEADSFASANGLVENWVLVGYGIADRDKASDDPKYSGNYYGGTFTIEYNLMDSRFPNDTDLPEGSELEVTLTPDGPLLDGSKGRTITIRRKVQDGQRSNVYVNNVPVGTYRITGRLLQGSRTTKLRFREVGPNFGKSFGLDPKEGADAATLTFRPGSAKAGMAPVAHGNWDALAVQVSR